MHQSYFSWLMLISFFFIDVFVFSFSYEQMYVLWADVLMDQKWREFLVLMRLITRAKPNCFSIQPANLLSDLINWKLIYCSIARYSSRYLIVFVKKWQHVLIEFENPEIGFKKNHLSVRLSVNLLLWQQYFLTCKSIAVLIKLPPIQ